MPMKKQNKDKVLKARCDAELKSRVDQIAAIQRLDASDIVRQAVFSYVQNFRPLSVGVARG
jgi:predicted transcriptional regulator